MLRHAYRAATWVLVVVVLASSLAAIFGVAQAAPTNYVLTGYVDQPGLSAPPVPAGVTVDLVSRATGAVYTSVVTGNGGQFSFTTTGTSGALAPGYWSVAVPVATNTTVSGCRPCAILPTVQNPTYQYYNSTQLTNSSYSTSIHGVGIFPYNATFNGTVTQGAGTVQGAQVRLLAPTYNGAVLVANVTNATGKFSLSAPFGTWVLQVTHASGPNTFSSTSPVTIASRNPAPVSVSLKSFELSGHMVGPTLQPVPSAGNATLFDPANGYIYTTPTAAGGYYQFSTYPANFTSGNQTFELVGASSGYQTGWFSQVVSGQSTVTHNLTLGPIAPSSLGVFATTIDLTGVNVTTGRGSIGVATNVLLGNDSVVPGLPNATVGQLWAQLGLDFNRTLSFPASDFPALRSWIGASGPFFPAVQAGVAINGTLLVGPQGTSNLSSFTAPAACSVACGLTSSAALQYGWNASYALNGTIPKSAASYTLSFKFAHPGASSDVYNYTFHLPAGYVLSAGTSAPAHSKLVGIGPGGTWTNFTLVSQASATASASATFTLVKAAALTAIVNISAKNFTFSKANVYNSTRGSYAVVLGPNENATFSAANSTFPSGTNGTSFTWNFGDGHTATVTNLSTNHTYTAANGSNPWVGSLTIVGSGGHRSTTAFKVWIISAVPRAVIQTNATGAKQNFTQKGYVFLSWNHTLQINASKKGLVAPNNWSISSFKLTSNDFNASRNNSVAQGGSFGSNWSVAFGGASKPGAGRYINFSTILVNGSAPTVKGWGWEYNLTLTVWTAAGTSNSTSLVILINDTEKPVPSINLQGPGGNSIGANGIVEGSNHSAEVLLNATGSSDRGNGTIVSYKWVITLKGNTSFSKNVTVTKAKPVPAIWLAPENKTYRVNLTVTDKNGNTANATKTLTVSKNATVRPIMEASNLTGPSSVNVGTSYTFWVNITVGGGAQANGTNVTVTFYLRSASGTGSLTDIAGSPTSVVFYGYSNNTTNATVNSTPLATGEIANLARNTTVRAQVTWDPSTSGSFTLYANVTAANEFYGDYGSTNIASTAVTVHPNPTTQLLEYAAIGVAVVVVIGLLIFYYRRRSRRASPSKPTSGRSGLERGKGASDEDDDS